MTDRIKASLEAEHRACLADETYRAQASAVDARAADKARDARERERGALYASRNERDWRSEGGPDLALDEIKSSRYRMIVGALAGTVEWSGFNAGYLTREEVEKALKWADLTLFDLHRAAIAKARTS